MTFALTNRPEIDLHLSSSLMDKSVVHSSVIYEMS